MRKPKIEEQKIRDSTDKQSKAKNKKDDRREYLKKLIMGLDSTDFQIQIPLFEKRNSTDEQICFFLMKRNCTDEPNIVFFF